MQFCIILLKSKVNRQLAGFPGSPSIANHEGRGSVVQPRFTWKRRRGDKRITEVTALLSSPLSFFLSLPFSLLHFATPPLSFIKRVRAGVCVSSYGQRQKKRAKKRRGPQLWYGFAFPPSSTLEAGDHGVESTIRSQRERYKPRLVHPRVARSSSLSPSVYPIQPPRDTLPTPNVVRPSIRPLCPPGVSDFCLRYRVTHRASSLRIRWCSHPLPTPPRRCRVAHAFPSDVHV